MQKDRFKTKWFSIVWRELYDFLCGDRKDAAPACFCRVDVYRNGLRGRQVEERKASLSADNHRPTSTQQKSRQRKIVSADEADERQVSREVRLWRNTGGKQSTGEQEVTKRHKRIKLQNKT